jgi:phosphoglycolate phosphatase
VTSRPIEAVLFDKDGTLIDFHATWGPSTGAGLRAAAHDEAALVAAAKGIGFDLAADRFLPGAAFIAEPNEVIMALLEPHVNLREFEEACMAVALTATTPAPGVVDLLHRLQEDGVAMAVVTNDWAHSATAQLEVLGWVDLFDTVVGSDSGYGAKPEPGMVLGACKELGVDPQAAVMVGDTAHDINAGAAAGVRTVLVTNGETPDDAATKAATRVIQSLKHFPKDL